MIQDHFIALGQPEGGVFFGFQLTLPIIEIVLEIDETQDFPGLAVYLVLLTEGE